VSDSTSPLAARLSPKYEIDRLESTITVLAPLSDHDWDTIMGVMKELQVTNLHAGGQMTDAALERLAELDLVNELDLSGSRRLTDDGLWHLARMPKLQVLNLGGWENPITDRGLEVLRHLRELRRFQMCWPQGVSDEGVANLAFCDHLESVDLLGTPTGDGAIAALRGKRALRTFKSGTQVTDAGLALLHDFPAFQAWRGGEMSYALMSADARPSLELHQCTGITDAGVAHLATLPRLRKVSVCGSPKVTPNGAAVFSADVRVNF
jgi:F-box/leucine-rich repeat protein 14